MNNPDEEELAFHAPVEVSRRRLTRVDARPLRARVRCGLRSGFRNAQLTLVDFTRDGIKVASINELFSAGERVWVEVLDPYLSPDKPSVKGLKGIVRHHLVFDEGHHYGVEFVFDRWFGNHDRYDRLIELEAMLYKRNVENRLAQSRSGNGGLHLP